MAFTSAIITVEHPLGTIVRVGVAERRENALSDGRGRQATVEAYRQAIAEDEDHLRFSERCACFWGRKVSVALGELNDALLADPKHFGDLCETDQMMHALAVFGRITAFSAG